MQRRTLERKLCWGNFAEKVWQRGRSSFNALLCIFSCFCLLVLLSSLSFASDNGRSTQVLHLAAGTWPPFTGQHLPGYGCDSQVVQEAFALVGIQVRYSFYPWARGLLLSQHGVIDGAIEWADTPKNRQSHYISDQPLSTQQWVFFRRKEMPFSWQHLEDLHRFRIGLTIGYAYSDIFVQMREKYPQTFVSSAGDILNFNKLRQKQIDLFPMEKTVGQYLLHKRLSPQTQRIITADAHPLAPFYPHLLLSKMVEGNQRRLELFETGFAQLKKSGRYQQIMHTCTKPENWLGAGAR